MASFLLRSEHFYRECKLLRAGSRGNLAQQSHWEFFAPCSSGKRSQCLELTTQMRMRLRGGSRELDDAVCDAELVGFTEVVHDERDQTTRAHPFVNQRSSEDVFVAISRLSRAPPALGKCRSGGGCIIVGHVFLQLPVSVSSRNKQGYAWLALHDVAVKRNPRSGILQLTHSYRPGSENCNLHFRSSTGVPPCKAFGLGGRGFCKRSPFYLLLVLNSRLRPLPFFEAA